METLESEKSKNKILMGIIVALLLAIAVTGFYLYSGNVENVDLTADKALLETNFKNLSDTLDVRSSDLQQITDNNTLLDSTVTAYQAAIDAKKKEIAVLLSNKKMNKGELEKAKKLIAEYEADILGLQQQILDLVTQNHELAKENQQLDESLTIEKKTTTALLEQNKGLSKTVEVGSLLQLSPVLVEGVKQRLNGRDRAVRNAKAAESLKVSFEAGQNKVLPAGPVSLYVRVINPKGETISVANQGSGTLQLTESGTPVQYSTKADIDWNQTGKKVVIYWKQYISTAGTYKVEIYQGGYLIGLGQVTLK
jgi:cell division protein FtsB